MIQFKLFALFLLPMSMMSLINGTKSDVLIFNDSNFDTKIAKMDTTLVMFYAPWCPHCQELKPHFVEAAAILKDHNPRVYLAKVDCTEGAEVLCERFSVEGYPTLLLFKNGHLVSEYDGPTTTKGIVKNMKIQTRPASIELKTVEEYENFIAQTGEIRVVALIKEKSKLNKSLMIVANKLKRRVHFATISCPTLLKKYSQKPALELHRPAFLANSFEPDSATYKGALEDHKLLEGFIRQEFHGLVGIRTPKNANDFKPPFVIVYYDVNFKTDASRTNYYRNRILKVAQLYKNKISFGVSSPQDFELELEEFGIFEITAKKPIVVAMNEEDRKFKLTEDFTAEKFKKFVKDFDDNELEPLAKQVDEDEEDPFRDLNDGPVIVADGDNFKEVVMNNGQDTLIEFYAPWCGYCQKLAPVYNELGLTMEDEDVAIIKMDADANQVPPLFDVEGFPTLFWLPKDSKNKPIMYEEEMGLQDFIKFIAKEATNPLKGFDRSGNPVNKKKIEL